jgi:serpin B
MKKILLASIIAIALLLGSQGVLAAKTAESTNKLIQGNNKFAVDLYKALSTERGNLFFSPFSISAALSMTYTGASGNTEREMANTLHFTQGRDQVSREFSAILSRMEAQGKKGDYQLSIANRLWGQKGYGFLPPFLENLKKNYGAGLQEVDFINATESTRITINKWVEGKTQRRIKNLIPKNVLGPLTRLVLTNAIYFKGNWASQFKKDATQNAPFHLKSGSKVDVPVMAQVNNFRYAKEKDLALLQMPYKGNDLSMLILLPDKSDYLPVVEKNLSSASLEKWMGSLREQRVQVFVPKFKMTRGFALKDVLMGMGMKVPFTNAADFSGMNGRKDLLISAVIHQAFVEVNEEGTEAAAATAVVVGLKSAAPPQNYVVFRADHPFMFIIMDDSSGSILFVGRVEDPRG